MSKYNEMFNGVVGQVGVFPIKDSIKNMTVNKPGEHYGKQFNIEKTHTVAIKVAELCPSWITIGHRKFRPGDELSWRVDTGSEWEDVWSGSKVFFFYEKNIVTKDGESKTYINVDANTIKLMEQAGRPEKVYTFGTAEPNSGGDSGGGAGGGAPYDASGAIKGNAFNNAMELLKFKPNAPKFGEIAGEVLRINDQLKKEYPTAPGASIGMVINAACKSTKDIKKVYAVAKGFLDNELKQVDAIWDGGVPSNTPDETPKNDPAPQEDQIPDDEIPF